MNAGKRQDFSRNRVADGDRNAALNWQIVPNADVISPETIVHVLVNKGICTPDELFSLEGRIQKLNETATSNQVVNIQNQYDRGRFPELKRAMSKHRWSRRLGSFLFGWKWKKVKKNALI
ncbi:MAG: hypothetical protein ONB16_06135 [candidate division KSB1 bacterium]|nr:hypothetical protein [candidate division KSB1 bacterium]MDZ7341308.1 hypothetical protein [candidate division KSB1 bacterium]